jgi:hypothetical protein
MVKDLYSVVECIFNVSFLCLQKVGTYGRETLRLMLYVAQRTVGKSVRTAQDLNAALLSLLYEANCKYYRWLGKSILLLNSIK